MAEQLGLEGMPTRLFQAFPTRLTTWLDCPRRYRMTYLDRPTPPRGAPWAHTSVGAAIHTALKRWYDLPAGARTPAAAGDLVEECWLTDGFRDDAQCEEWRGRARAMVEHYVAGLDPHEEPQRRRAHRRAAHGHPRRQRPGRPHRRAPRRARGRRDDGDASRGRAS